MTWYRCGILTLILGLYVGSFCLPALTLCNRKYETELLGAHAFLQGAIALLWGESPAFLANSLLCLGWIALVERRWKVAATLGGGAVLLAASAWRLYDPRGLWNLPPAVAADLWPEDERIRRFLPGYYCWLASMSLLSLEAFRGWLAASLWGRSAAPMPLVRPLVSGLASARCNLMCPQRHADCA
jgi:hypothetical protein